jgi:hypothetical protein
MLPFAWCMMHVVRSFHAAFCTLHAASRRPSNHPHHHLCTGRGLPSSPLQRGCDFDIAALLTLAQTMSSAGGCGASKPVRLALIRRFLAFRRGSRPADIGTETAWAHPHSHLHRDWAHAPTSSSGRGSTPAHICSGLGTALPTCAGVDARA